MFTKAYAQQRFFQYGLEGDHVRYQDVDGQLMIDIGQGGGSNLYDWNLDTLKIVEQTEDRIVVNMDYISSYGEAGNADLTLLKEDGQWKFTSDFA